MIHNEHNDTVSVALGTFDGLHIGHRAVITADKTEYSRRAVLMFTQHPQKIINGVSPGELVTRKKCAELLHKWGVEPVYTDFAAIADYSPREFFEKIIIGELHADAVSCGFNYRFGKDAGGDTALLKELCTEYGVKLTVCDAVEYDGAPVSSTRIREALRSGDIRSANMMLGRRYSYAFEVVHGDERGRTLGSPTANQFFGEDMTVPQFGVYASFTTVDGVKYPSVTNIGVRPTVGSSTERSETHIIGFSGNLYGTFPEVELVQKLRDEKQFSSFEELSENIAADRAMALAILKKEEK